MYCITNNYKISFRPDMSGISGDDVPYKNRSACSVGLRYRNFGMTFNFQ